MNYQKYGVSKMWAVIGGAVVLILLFFFSDALPAGILLPVILGACVLMHIWMMVRGGHGSHPSHDQEKQPLDKGKQEKEDKHKGGCCH